MRRIFVQFLRYCLVGGLAFAVDFGTMLLLHKVFGVHYRIAAGSGFLLGLIINYAISVWWVFDSHTLKNRFVEFAIFAAIGLLGLLINDQVIHACTELLGFDPGISKLPAAAVVLMVNFSLRKFLLFQSRD